MRHRGSVVTLCLLAALLVTGTASIARAKGDAYETKLRDVNPSVAGLELRTEGDRSLVLKNETGKTVIVKGYDNDQFDDPYLRFGPRGLVEVNVNSTAKFLNADPSGKAPLPPPFALGRLRSGSRSPTTGPIRGSTIASTGSRRSRRAS